MKYFAMIATLLVLSLPLFAQVEISGTVTDGASGEPLPGASVNVQGTTTGVITDFNGAFALAVPGDDAVLVVSFVGYESQTLVVGSQRTFNITLEVDATELDEVVVTALGISRESKSLGYSVQEVNGEEIAETNPTNVVAALSGKIAGAQIVTSSGQVGASTTIQLRGNKGFGLSSPLFVVDGTPIMNSTSSARDSDTYTDFGNAAMDIDPENIESISVLKGASASALYGSRGNNGVILITTKKGSKKQGVGVEFNTSAAWDNVYVLPNYQNEYGQGRNGSEYEWKNNYGDLSYQEFHDTREFIWSTDGSGRRLDWDESWGSRLDAGLMVPQFDSPLDENGDYTATPWISRPDNVKDFYETGFTTTNNLAFVAGGERSNGRLTLGYANQKGTAPNTDQKKINVGLNTHSQLSKKLSFDVNVNYVKLSNDNLPQQGNSMRNPLLAFNSWFGRQVNTQYLEDHYEDIIDYEGQEMAFNWMMGYPSQHPNPYWMANKNTMERDRNRMFGNVAVNYDIVDGIKLVGRVGTDFYTENRRYKWYKYSRDWTDMYENATNGNLWQQTRMQAETNADLMLTIDKDLTEDLSLFATVGANYKSFSAKYNTTHGFNLVVADFFSTSNYSGEPYVSFTQYNSMSNSVYGSANLGFKDYLFLDLTLRGDWSSKLPKENWNFWYPSANLGFIFTDAFGIESDVLSFGKLRLGVARVGDDDALGAYALEPVFYSQGSTMFNGVNMFGAQSSLPTYDLKPRMTNSIEFGGAFKLFQNRLGIDLTYYNATTYNQILSVEIAPSSGFSSWLKNAGTMHNQGVELEMYGTILKTASGFSWNANLNWSTNKNIVEELDDGLDQLEIQYWYYGTSLMAFPGESFGSIYGTTFLRNEAGEKVVNENGMPIESDTPEVLGSVNPDWVGGIGNTFSYKGFSIYALIDFRKGGDVFSYTKTVGQKAGILQATVEGGIRENGMLVDGVYEDGSMVDVAGDGVEVDMSGQPNQSVISARSYWRSSRSWGELAIVDGSFIKLREVSIAYQIPRNLTSQIGIQSATLSLYGRNLALLYTHKSNDVGIDPEVSSGGTTSGIGLESYQLPPSRTLGVKLSLKF